MPNETTCDRIAKSSNDIRNNIKNNEKPHAVISLMGAAEAKKVFEKSLKKLLTNGKQRDNLTKLSQTTEQQNLDK